MLPVLLPTLAAAVIVMAISQLILRSAARSTVHQEPSVPLASRASKPMVAMGPSLELSAHRRLRGFELDVAWRTNARRLAILGASGSGKSLTLRVIAGLGPTDGSLVRFDGLDLSRLPAEARGIAYVPQSYGLLPNLAVAEQVRFAVDCDSARARHWTERMGLLGLEGRRPHELSLGQQQRVALARALSRRSASLLLLDEPFSALDTPLRIRLRREMLMLQRELEVTTILVTHDPAEAMLLADELLLIDSGRVLQAGPVGSIFTRPVNETAARLLGVETMGCGRVAGSNRIDIGKSVYLLVAGPE
jgi:molybdate transport system permease protein